jgi:hypothetical protein
MRLSKLLPLSAILLLGLAGCKDQEVRAKLNSWTTQLNAWHVKVYTSLCELEKLQNLDTTKRLCPGGPGDPGGAPPPPPPFGA